MSGGATRRGVFMFTWDPHLYLKFSGERTRPAAELAARITVERPRRIIDLGCGPGNSTAVLRARWPNADIAGLDRDETMLAAARESEPGVQWISGDAAKWQSSRAYDIVFSNAMLQWLRNQPAVLSWWFAAVRPGGALAVQVPNHVGSTLHRCMAEIANRPEWRDATAEAGGAIETHNTAYYYDALCQAADRIDAWETEYQHVVSGPRDILDWVRATGLRPFLSALPSDDERRRFETELTRRLADEYPRRPDGRVLFPFRRIFWIAYCNQD